ncbi:hypothetical protein [Frankia sp. ACN1ag]|uniref:hypothetical protein n=1 Tax=Frankia sp. ACN1ag TaxID=102891 RepID=UPI00128FC104|nr:hypothetical protein [Frankia sp. ACN1ag]
MTQVTYTDGLADGSLVDMDGWGVIDFRGLPLNRVSGTLYRALKGAFGRAATLGAPAEECRRSFPDWTPADAVVPFWANLGELLAAYLRDASDDEEGPGSLFTTAPVAALGGRPLWVQPNGTGYTAFFPEDY